MLMSCDLPSGEQFCSDPCSQGCWRLQETKKFTSRVRSWMHCCLFLAFDMAPIHRVDLQCEPSFADERRENGLTENHLPPIKQHELHVDGEIFGRYLKESFSRPERSSDRFIQDRCFKGWHSLGCRYVWCYWCNEHKWGRTEQTDAE